MRRVLAPIVFLAAACGPQQREAPPAQPAPSTPPVFAVAGSPLRLKLVQRTARLVPATGAEPRLAIGDITAGEVSVTLTDGDAALVPQRSMREGDVAAFTCRGQRYELRLVRLANALIGNDAAEFEIGAAGGDDAGDPAAQIEALLAKIAASPLEFVRNGTAHSGAAAAAHIRRKYDYAGKPARSADAFIDDFATRSSTSDEEYVVRDASGKTLPLAAWLRGRVL